MVVTIEVNQAAILDILDEMKAQIQGYLSEPDTEGLEEVMQLFNTLYSYIANQPLASSTHRKISARRV